MRTITEFHPSKELYSGLDAIATLQVYNKLLPELDPVSRRMYEFSKSLQGPVLEMSARGVLVDRIELFKIRSKLEKQRQRLDANFERLVDAITGKELNLRSHKQKKEFLYDTLELPRVFKNDKGERKLTSDKNALDKLYETQPWARPIISHMQGFAKLDKQIQILNSGLDPDGRFRFQLNIGGTNTFRFSSSESIYHTGSNGQNLPESFLSMFIADPGMIMIHVDLEQSDARIVGAKQLQLFDDPRYLDYCESGDLHTNVAKLIWPHIQSRADADKIYSDGKSYRYMCKKLGHGTSFRGMPPKMAKETRIPLPIVQDFRKKFLPNFSHEEWWQWVATEIQTKEELTTMMGFRRQFFDRTSSDETLRAAIAFEPQSVTATYNKQGMLNLWHEHIVQLLMETHDSIDMQVPLDQAEAVLKVLPEILKIVIPIRGRDFSIPHDIKVGYNMGTFDEEHPDETADSLRKWTGVIPQRKKTPSLLPFRLRRHAS